MHRRIAWCRRPRDPGIGRMAQGSCGPRPCEKGSVSAPPAERRQYSRHRTQISLEAILRAPL